MPKRSLEQAWRVALAAVAVIATAMALSVQLIERRSRQEEERLAAARLEEAIAASRAEILSQLRREIAEEKAATSPGGPLPNAVLRRGEPGEGDALRQVVGAVDSQQALAIAELRKSLEDLSSQVEQSNGALRRDLEKLRLEIRRDLDASDRAVSFLIIALIPLLAQLLLSIWQPGRRSPEGAEQERT